MRKLIRSASIMVLVVICTSGKLSWGKTLERSSLSWDLNAFMSVEEIQPGMKGVGKTVFSGTQIEEFQVEIVGVLKNVTPRGDMILAKVTGGSLPLERTGVIAGMSGSPIYIQGRLIGALAYTLSIFQTEPMAGITPILEMLEEYERNKADLELDKRSILKARKEAFGSRIKMFNFWNSVMIQKGELILPNKLDFQNWLTADQELDESLDKEFMEEMDTDVDYEIHQLKSHLSKVWNPQSTVQGPWFTAMDNGLPTVNLGQVYSSGFIPIKTPLTLSGVDARVIKEMTPFLESLGIIPVQGGNFLASQILQASEVSPQGKKSLGGDGLLPGSAVGVQLIRGDMSASGFGTVTYVDENHLMAFGHPMFAAGKVDIPMTSAYVHMVIANQINSFKIASPISIKGSIRQDRRTGIMGVMGSYPRMLPLKVIVESEKDSKKNEYNFEVIHDDFFAPLFVRISCLNAIFASEKAVGNATVKVQAEVYLKDGPPIIHKNIFSGDSALLLASLASTRPLGMLMNNPFEDIEVERILITLSVTEKLEVAQIEGARVSKDVLKPGESMQVTVFIRPFLGELITQKVPVVIPENVSKGQLRLMACDSQSVNAFEKFRAPLNFEPQSLAQLINLLETEEQNNEIIVQLLHPKAGVTLKGREFSSPPTSLLALMSSPRHGGEGGLTRGTILMRKRLPTDYVVSGCELLTITVDDKYGVDSDLESNSKVEKGDSL